MGLSHPASLPGGRTVGLPVGVSATAASAGLHFTWPSGIRRPAFYTWGSNEVGQLGDGTATRSTPRAVLLHPGVTPTAIAAGDGRSLAIGSDGNAYAWGGNFFGELGDGTTTQRSSPVRMQLPAGVTAVSIAAGHGYSLVVGSDGRVYGWGQNPAGQLGIGATADGLTPAITNVPVGTYATAVSARNGTLVIVRPTTQLAGAYHPVTPARALDTRVGAPTVDGLDAGGGPVEAGHVVQLPVAGRAGVAADAVAVAMNVTAVEPDPAGFVTVFPCGDAVPNAVNLNYRAGDVVPNSVVVKSAPAGRSVSTRRRPPTSSPTSPATTSRARHSPPLAPLGRWILVLVLRRWTGSTPVAVRSRLVMSCSFRWRGGLVWRPTQWPSR